MEIITGIERRRRWSDGDKLRVVAEAELPGVCLAAIARRHDFSRSLLCGVAPFKPDKRLGLQTAQR